MSFKVPEKNRIDPGTMASSPGFHYGAFKIHMASKTIYCIADDGEETGWEHVSVRISERKGKILTDRTPTWNEMCLVKDLFWDKEDCVIQYHPAESEYVNQHKFVLHLWRPKSVFPVPPKILVGI
jgi:hypothetical protein